MEQLLSVEEAQSRVIQLVRPTGAERLPVRMALGRILCEAVRARADFPPCDNSAMDGFAVRAADAAVAPCELTVAGEAAAGHPAERPLGPGEALRIMTGAPVPEGADAVVMVEHTEALGERVRILRPARAGQHVRGRGEEFKAGAVVLSSGMKLDAAALGLCATLGRAEVAVARRPVVAVLSTGDELLAVDEPARPGAIVDSNGYALAAAILEAGGIPRIQPIVRDRPDELKHAIEEAARGADFIASTGGVSMGEHDHVKAVLGELGAELVLWRVAMKPGKPVAVAQLGALPFFGLPGNPASALVAFFLFVRPALRAALGCAQPFDLPRVRVRLAAPVHTRGERRIYLRARVQAAADGSLQATPLSHQGSGMLSSMVGANALLLLEPPATELVAGASVPAVLIGPLG